ncbi:VOC family protein [Chloroflexota bacterium]
MKFEKIDHIGIMVKDLEKASKFFAELFDTEFNIRDADTESDIRTSMSNPTCIELVTPLKPDGAAAKALEHRGEGLTMLSLKVPNLEEAIANMESHGVRLLRREKLPSAKMAFFHPKDLHGVMLELIERE